MHLLINCGTVVEIVICFNWNVDFAQGDLELTHKPSIFFMGHRQTV